MRNLGMREETQKEKEGYPRRRKQREKKWREECGVSLLFVVVCLFVFVPTS